jgi:uncharacterized protein (TIGR03437 family)
MTVKVYLPSVFLCAFLFAGVAPANNVFVLPNTAASQTVQVFTGNPLASAGTFQAGPANVIEVVAAPGGTAYYVLTSATSEALIKLNASFTVVSRSGAWNDPGQDMAITPDGTKLLVLAGTLRVFNLASDAEIASVPVGSSPRSVAVGIDSRYALVLSSNSQKLYRVDLTTNTVTATLDVLGGSAAVAAGPDCLFYLSRTNQILVLDASDMSVKYTIPLNGAPEKLYFTPDGKHAVATNSSVVSGSSGWIFSLENRSVAAALPVLQTGLDKVVMNPRVQIVSNGRVLLTSAVSKVIYSATIPAGDLTALNIGGVGSPTDVTGLVKSAELPNAKFAYYLSGAVIGRFTPNNDQASGTPVAVSEQTAGALYAGPPSAGPAVDKILYNAGQNINPGGQFKPISFRALDSNGIPVFNATVEFATDVAGVTIKNASSRTGIDGLAKAEVDPGGALGPIPIKVTVGGSLQFTIDLGVGAGGGGQTGGIEIVSGQGQLTGDLFSFTRPLRVKVTDGQGQPVAGATVSWALAGEGTLTATSSTTDGTGMAQTEFRTVRLSPGVSWSQATVTASYGAGSVMFYVTTYPGLQLSGRAAPPPQATLNKPPLANRRVEGKTGTTLKGALEAQVVAGTGIDAGIGIPNVALEASTGLDPAAGPVGDCAGKFALTNAQGIASCDLMLGGKLGSANLGVTVGGTFTSFPNVVLTVLAGDPAIMGIVQGDGQTGKPGQTLPLKLVAEVRDFSNNPLAGQPVLWEVLDAGKVTLSNVETTSNASGRVSASVTLGNAPGAARIKVTSGAATATFTVTIDVRITQLLYVSGNMQTAITGQAFGAPLIVQLLDENNNPATGLDVGFAVTSGVATLSANSATTDAQGRASVQATAGVQPGTVTVTAAFADLPAVVFTLTVRAPGPAIGATSFVNAASGQPGVVPGSIAIVRGAGLAPGVQNCVVPYSPYGALPIELSGVRVEFDAGAVSKWAPIFWVCNTSGQEAVAFQTPWEVAAGTSTVKVHVGGGGSTTVANVPVLPVQPGIFETIGASGLRYAVVLKSNGSAVSDANPANQGETVALVATGLGGVTPATSTNSVGTAQKVAATLVVGVNNGGVRVIGGEYAANLIGVYLVYFEVPQNTTTGTARPLALGVRGPGDQIVWGNGSSIAIR